ncbi:MAG: cell envelope integrity protein TolA, partial [Cellvibrionaceae bacterium]|nr:cell envelope integrity protein TolA [Cellvibrionaceae bacterium]
AAKQAGIGMTGILVSVTLHALLVAAVFWGWQSAEPPKRQVSPKYVQAKLVQLKPKSQKKPAAKPKPKIIDLTKKKREQQRKKAEQEKKRKLAKQKAERDKKAREKKAREKKAKEKAAREKAAKEKAAREKAAKEKAAKQKAARERELQRQLDAEMEAERKAMELQQQAEEDEQYSQSYSAIIAQKVENYWSRPGSARKGMQCVLRISLVPTGRVVNVTVVKSSGNAAFDRSAENAVRRAEEFPELKQLPLAVFERNFRQFTLTFNPKDLRL